MISSPTSGSAERALRRRFRRVILLAWVAGLLVSVAAIGYRVGAEGTRIHLSRPLPLGVTSIVSLDAGERRVVYAGKRGPGGYIPQATCTAHGLSNADATVTAAPQANSGLTRDGREWYPSQVIQASSAGKYAVMCTVDQGKSLVVTANDSRLNDFVDQWLFGGDFLMWPVRLMVPPAAGALLGALVVVLVARRERLRPATDPDAGGGGRPG